jgi:hypothetical protein
MKGRSRGRGQGVIVLPMGKAGQKKGDETPSRLHDACFFRHQNHPLFCKAITAFYGINTSGIMNH